MRLHRLGSFAALFCVTAVVVLGDSAPALAVAGGKAAAAGSYSFVAQLDIGNGVRACTGALVDAQWVLTAGSCFAENGQPAAAGRPAKPTTATIGRTDLTSTAGHVVIVVDVVPRADRDLVLAKLATPVTDIAPVAIATTPPAAAEALRIAGYGRTSSEWVPDRLYAAAVAVQTLTDTTVAVTGTGSSPDASTCKGDAGGPTFRENAAGPELVALHSSSWQHGCYGETQTRTGSTETRIDNVGDWVKDTIRPHGITLTNAFSHRCLSFARSNSGNGEPAGEYSCVSGADEQAWELRPADGGGYLVRNRFTGRCLVVVARTSGEGSGAVQFDCYPYADQIWQVVAVTGGYQLRNQNSQKCLVVFARTSGEGAPAAQSECNAAYADQVWQTAAVPDGVTLTNAFSHRCLSFARSNSGNGEPAGEYSCVSGADEQAWELRPADGGGYLVRNRFTGRCLVVVARTSGEGSGAVQFDCYPYADQIWQVVAVTGGYQLRNQNSQKCLVVFARTSGEGAPAAQSQCNAAYADQVWQLDTPAA